MALGPDIKNLLNSVRPGVLSVPSRVFLPLMEIGLLGIDQCTIYRHGENSGIYFISALILKDYGQGTS